MESLYMIGRTVAVILTLIIVGYALFIRPKEEDAPKRMSTFQWLMKKRREKRAAEFAEAAAARARGQNRKSAEGGVESGNQSSASTDDGTGEDVAANTTAESDERATSTEALTIAQQKRAKGEKKVRG